MAKPVTRVSVGYKASIMILVYISEFVVSSVLKSNPIYLAMSAIMI